MIGTYLNKLQISNDFNKKLVTFFIIDRFKRIPSSNSILDTRIVQPYLHHPEDRRLVENSLLVNDIDLEELLLQLLHLGGDGLHRLHRDVALLGEREGEQLDDEGQRDDGPAPGAD